MTELLPIVFARGQNEGIDPRVADPSVLSVAQNVRWRKDGRPAKRYGITQYATTNFDAGSPSWSKHNVNFIDQWRGQPVLGIGGTTRRLVKGASWNDVNESAAAYGSYWGPGRRDTVAFSDQLQFNNSTVAYCNGFVLTAWDDGTNVYYSIATADGAQVVARGSSFTGTFPRAVSPSSSNFVHLIYKNGTALTCVTFDMSSSTFSQTSTSLGTLSASATAAIDAVPRTTDWLVVYQATTTQLIAKSFTSAATPSNTALQGISTAASPGTLRASIAATGAASGIAVCWLESATGTVCFSGLDNALNTLSTRTVVETDANNIDTPVATVSQFSTVSATICWANQGSGGNPIQTLRWEVVNLNGSIGGTSNKVANCRIVSRPFFGNSADVNLNDSLFIWVTTDNGSSGASGWYDQRTFHLLSLPNGAQAKSVLYMSSLVGSLPGAAATTGHVSDVVSDGSGTNNTTYWTTFQNAARSSIFGTLDGLSIELVSFKSIFARQREAARDTVTAGRALQISGGALYEFTGYLEESGFMHAPVIVSATPVAGGFLTASATYLYRAVYEWVDTQGRRHRSAPSDPFAATTTSVNKSVTLLVAPLAGYARLGAPSLHIYRTLAGGSTYQRVTANQVAPSAIGAALLSYTDVNSDAALAGVEFIYTDGGVAANDFPPPSTFMCLNATRVWLGGQFERNVITASKLLVDTEPTQFSLDNEFSVFLPEECTGLASLDGTVVAFAREAIYLVSGDGPNDEGNGAFNAPQKLPTDVGCVDWRSIVSYSEGVFFQSKRGIYMLARGFDTPQFVGSAVEDTFASFPICMSATLVSQPGAIGHPPEITVRFVMASAERVTSATQVRTLVYDPRVQGWSVDLPADNSKGYGPGGTWLDTFVQTKTTATGVFDSIWKEDFTTYAENGNGITTKLETGNVRPFGVTGYGQFKEVVVVGEFRAACTVNVLVSVDGGSFDFFQYTLTSADGIDGVVYLEANPSIQKGSSIQVIVQDFNATPGEGFIPQALQIETDLIGHTKRLAAGRKA